MFANLRRLLVALTLAGCGLVLAPFPAHAGVCPPLTTQEHAKGAGAIFTGVVTNVDKELRPGGQRGTTFVHEVEVDLVYKGKIATTMVSVRTDQIRDTCSLGELAVGTTYVFFTQPAGDGWTASGASGTEPVNDTLLAKVERLLGEGRPPVPPEPETATFTAVSGSEPATLSRAAAPGLALVIIGLLGLIVAGRLSSRRG